MSDVNFNTIVWMIFFLILILSPVIYSLVEKWMDRK